MSNMSLLRMARLMRLSRLFRMARLLRMVPELLIMVKAISAATRSVFFTLALLLIVLYVFGIAFTQTLKETEVGTAFFASVPDSMQTLVTQGTLLDNITDLMDMLRATDWFSVLLMYVFIVLSAVTVMNMLIGVLCEVINGVAAAEKEMIQVSYVKDVIQKVMQMGIDQNGDGFIQKEEFFAMLGHLEAVEALKEVGVDVVQLPDFVDIIFENATHNEDNEPQLSFADFMQMVLQLRGSNTATVKDIADHRKWLVRKMEAHEEKMQEVVRAAMSKEHMISPKSNGAAAQPFVSRSPGKKASESGQAQIPGDIFDVLEDA